MQWNEKHVVTVGGSSGIGLGVARAALAAGARVTIVGRSPDRLARARRDLGDDGRVRAIAADGSREADVIRLSITFASGIAAYRPGPGGSVVAAVNGALAALGRALAIELAPIRVNVVSPGWVDTPIWDELAGERKADVLRGMADRLPVSRVATVDDLADAFLFLMQSAHTTGTVLHVDGGQRLV